ncbi:RPM1-interacting protein 4-like protein [Cinnamomum micranthum f. kanehirae]|uniref:RPM1-interacting protein 4-like protein n=1 Tax=Cinnamomum micranthum f. kanehirae TaxID=337451 RepID=A0A3S4P8L5_9MAGN|nr:RPM1-interacting protein 4-like protein [Cinnamomum micranthum f. kanehirae]
MAQRSHVPKFGNWEAGETVPYTAYFDKARQGRGGKIINPNDPQDNPDAFYDKMPPVHAPPTSSDPEVPAARASPAASKPKHVRHSSGEDGEFSRSVESPARNDIGGRKAVTDSPQRYSDRGGNSGNHPRGSRLSGTSDRSVEHSPLHPHQQTRAVSKGGVNSPSWERKGSSEAGRGHSVAPSTPARSKLRSSIDETPERGPAVPKFGEWDENNPASADGFTHIFNKVREEKQTGAAKVPAMPTESSYNDHRKDSSDDFGPVKCWCFPLGRK